MREGKLWILVRQYRNGRTSTFSGTGGGDCVQWLLLGTDVLVRDSKNRDVTLRFTRSEWIAFVAGVKAGQADL